MIVTRGPPPRGFPERPCQRPRGPGHVRDPTDDAEQPGVPGAETDRPLRGRAPPPKPQRSRCIPCFTFIVPRVGVRVSRNVGQISSSRKNGCILWCGTKRSIEERKGFGYLARWGNINLPLGGGVDGCVSPKLFLTPCRGAGRGRGSLEPPFRTGRDYFLLVGKDFFHPFSHFCFTYFFLVLPCVVQTCLSCKDRLPVEVLRICIFYGFRGFWQD